MIITNLRTTIKTNPLPRVLAMAKNVIEINVNATLTLSNKGLESA